MKCGESHAEILGKRGGGEEMTYKGYIGVVEYDDDAKIFTGVVGNTRDVITFQGTSVDELEREFHLSVDDYLEWCKQDGIAPEKPYSGKFNVRFSPELHRQASTKAASNGVSLNHFVETAVRHELNAV